VTEALEKETMQEIRSDDVAALEAAVSEEFGEFGPETASLLYKCLVLYAPPRS